MSNQFVSSASEAADRGRYQQVIIIKSPQELQKILTGQVDSTRISDDFIDLEDRLGQLMRDANEYRELYERERKRNQEIADSLAVVEAKVKLDSAYVAQQQAVLDSQKTGAKHRLRQENLKGLATYYAKIKAQSAADIFQEGTYPDTSVAMLMRLLPPGQMAKIMQSMTPDFAANITKMMEELKQDDQQQ